MNLFLSEFKLFFNFFYLVFKLFIGFNQVVNGFTGMQYRCMIFTSNL